MNWEVFRAYDIRGIYPDRHRRRSVLPHRQSLRLLLQTKHDGRRHGCAFFVTALKASLIQGFLDAGVDVVDIGEITTDMLYYAVGAFDYSGGVVVSASHNPKEYNGMKMVREKATAISSDTGLFDIRDALKAGKDAEVTSDKKGTCTRTRHTRRLSRTRSEIRRSQTASKSSPLSEMPTSVSSVGRQRSWLKYLA